MSDHGSVQYVSQYFHLLRVQGFHVFRVSWGKILVLDGTGQVFYSRSLLVENVSAVHPLLSLQQGSVMEICFSGGLEGGESLSALS